MYAVTIPEFGGPDVLRWAEVGDPQPGPGEVVLDIVASAVNRADLLQRQGKYPPPPGAPPYPGLECSGRIATLGPDVTGWSVGDEVCALLPGGGYAERVVVDAGLLLPRPVNVSLTDAAALPEVACTVWSNVCDLAGLRAGEVFLVHGGAGGVGTFAIQLAHDLGARVFTTASPHKHAALRELGAEGAIDYHSEDFVTVVRDATDGHGADLVLDNMAAAYLGRNVNVLATGGRLVIIGTQGGRRAELDIGKLLSKRASVAATTLRSRPLSERVAIVRAVGEHVWPRVEAGAVRPIVDRRLPMHAAAEAHRMVEAGEHIGKVLLVRE